MKKLIVLLLAAVMCLSLAACGGNISGDDANNDADASTEVSTTETKVQNESSTQTNGLTDKEVIGTWEWKNFDEQGPANGVTHMELYEGGTGKGTNSEMTDGSYYSITWEINDNVINVTASDAPAIGLKLVDGKLVTVDGTATYTKK